MTRRTRFWTLTSTLSAFCACGEGPNSPTTTTTTASTTVTFTALSGETQEPVPGATIVIGGVEFGAGAPSSASVDLRVGTNVDVLAEGYFDRQTLYRGATENRIALWPMTSPTGLTPELTQRLVYSGWGRDAVLGEVPLRRPPVGELIHVFLDPEIAGDSRVRLVVEDAVAAMRAALQDQMTFVITTVPPARGTNWHVVIDPDAVDSDFIAITRWILDGQELVGADLAFRTLSDILADERLMTHMMGTAFGLRDSSDVNDRMYFDWWRRRSNDFSPKEGLVMRLMLQRPAGNRWPDNDRSLGAARLDASQVGYHRRPSS